MKYSLTMIGYWHSLFDADYPDPAWFVDKDWDPAIKSNVIAHLEKGTPMPYTFAGESWCRFRCDVKTGITHLGAGEFTDGKYVWPEGLSHYLQKHDVRLPQEIVNFILSGEQIDHTLTEDNFEIDHQWWKSQQGWNRKAVVAAKVLDLGCIMIRATDPKQKAAQEEALMIYLGKSGGIRGKLKSIEQVLTGETTRVKGRFSNVHNFIQEVAAIGLEVTFVEMSFAEFEASEA